MTSMKYSIEESTDGWSQLQRFRPTLKELNSVESFSHVPRSLMFAGFVATRKSRILTGLVMLTTLRCFAASPCDLNQDGVVNSADVTLAVNMALGTNTCSANVEGPNTCTVITVQRVINASEGLTCITYNTHGVTLQWGASSTPNVTYNVYRGAAAAGPFSKITNVSGLTYSDSAIQAGQTYYYVLTAVDVSGNESAYSTPAAQANIPTP